MILSRGEERAEVIGTLNILSRVLLGRESPLPATGVYITRARRLILCSEKASGSLGSGGGGVLEAVLSGVPDSTPQQMETSSLCPVCPSPLRAHVSPVSGISFLN